MRCYAGAAGLAMRWRSRFTSFGLTRSRGEGRLVTKQVCEPNVVGFDTAGRRHGAGFVIGASIKFPLEKRLHGRADILAHHELKALDAEIGGACAGARLPACRFWTELPKAKHVRTPELGCFSDPLPLFGC